MQENITPKNSRGPKGGTSCAVINGDDAFTIEAPIAVILSMKISWINQVMLVNRRSGWIEFSNVLPTYCACQDSCQWPSLSDQSRPTWKRSVVLNCCHQCLWAFDVYFCRSFLTKISPPWLLCTWCYIKAQNDDLAWPLLWGWYVCPPPPKDTDHNSWRDHRNLKVD